MIQILTVTQEMRARNMQCLPTPGTLALWADRLESAAKDHAAEVEALRAEVDTLQAMRKHHRSLHEYYKRRVRDLEAARTAKEQP